MNSLRHKQTIFKANIFNCFEVLNFIERKPEELWNEIQEIVKDECEKKTGETVH